MNLLYVFTELFLCLFPSRIPAVWHCFTSTFSFYCLMLQISIPVLQHCLRKALGMVVLGKSWEVTVHGKISNGASINLGHFFLLRFEFKNLLFFLYLHKLGIPRLLQRRRWGIYPGMAGSWFWQDILCAGKAQVGECEFSILFTFTPECEGGQNTECALFQFH